MNKKDTIILVVVLVFVSWVSVTLGRPKEEKINQNDPIKDPPIVVKTCDGDTITENCEVDGIEYSIYKFHPAEEEKFHYETETTYETKITGYCTLCNDGTYSPTCATGRGACSHHGGVAQFNAPIYREVPKKVETKVVDSPAKEAFLEKVVKE